MSSHAVLPYLDLADFSTLFPALAIRFPGAELIFNCYNAVGRRGANRLALKRSGIKDATIKWSVAGAKELTRWGSSIEVVDSWPVCSRVSRDPSWKRNTVMMVDFFTWFRCMRMVHLRFRQNQSSS